MKTNNNIPVDSLRLSQNQVSPFLQEVFMPLVMAIFEVLSRPAEENDQTAALEKQMLRRSYFSFIQTVASSGMNEIMASQGERSPVQELNTPVCLKIPTDCMFLFGRSGEYRACAVHHHPGSGGFPRPRRPENLLHYPVQTGGAVGYENTFSSV